MRILVAGGTGFVGSNLVLRLMEEGHDLLITGHDAEQKLPGFRGKYLQPGLLGIDWSALSGIDVLFHQAAINDTTLGDESEMMRANAEASRKLFETVIAGGCRSIVYATSTAVYGDVPAPYREKGPVNPLNAYARSKLALEAIAAETAAAHPGVALTGLRYCNVYGPRENHKGKRASMIWQLAQQMKAGNPRIFKMGEQKRDYIYVEDVVRANLPAIFPGVEILSAHLFRVIRDSDLELEQGDADDLLETVDRSLRQLRRGAISLVKVDADMPQRVLDILTDNFEVGSEIGRAHV